MNIFTLIGDFLHLASIFVLLVKIYAQKSCKGISLKTQVLYALVFCTRYLDLFYNFTSLYNWVMKIIFIASSCAIVYVMKFHPHVSKSYEPNVDNMRMQFIIVPCFLLGLVINDYEYKDVANFSYVYWFVEVLWAFSIYLEAVAIVPQLIVIHRYATQQSGFVENLTSHYVFCLGGYRAMYLLNWIYRFMTEPHYRAWIVWISGVIQTLMYCDFFYYYVTAQIEGKSMSLPI